MMILLNNVSWMGWNVFLALIPPIFGWLVLIMRQRVLKVACALIWFFFLPNTLYLITDLPHIIWQWHHMHHAGQIALALQYLTLVLIGSDHLSPGALSSGKSPVTCFLAEE